MEEGGGAIFAPGRPDEVTAAVRSALEEGWRLELVGGGSKRGLGGPVTATHRLDLSALSGIHLYEPEELVMTAGPATPLVEIEAALAAEGQQLAFEPPDPGPLWGGQPGRGTIGGVFACNLSGPRRVKAGAARDHLLGVKAVSGHGEAFKAGGRVVKNVTGYDLCKLLAGSYGTLAALTEVTFKVLPAAAKTRTLLLFGLTDEAAGRVLIEAATSPHDPSGLAHLPAALASLSAVSYVTQEQTSVTAIRLEGPAPSVEVRLAALKAGLGAGRPMAELHGHNSGLLWREIGDVHRFLGGIGLEGDGTLWRLSVPPASGPGVTARLAAAGVMGARWYYDWGGGLIWLALPGGDPQAQAVRGVIASCGGHATLVRASRAARAALPVFQPQPAAEAALALRVKESFDPRHILNPGRLVADG